MATKDPNKLYDLLKKMSTSMKAIETMAEDLLKDAQALVSASNDFGGEIARVMKEQVVSYLGPAIQKGIEPLNKYANDLNTPGALVGLSKFLDSCPLAFTRVEPSFEGVDDPVIPNDVNLAEPVSTNPVDQLPANASYANPIKRPVQESKITRTPKLTEAVLKYQVVRCTNRKSTLDKDKSGIKDVVVAEFDNEEDANLRKDSLNKTVNPVEQELFGTEYRVIKLALDPETIEN